jgi:UDP-glucose 4-epimerase
MLADAASGSHGQEAHRTGATPTPSRAWRRKRIQGPCITTDAARVRRRTPHIAPEKGRQAQGKAGKVFGMTVQKNLRGFLTGEAGRAAKADSEAWRESSWWSATYNSSQPTHVLDGKRILVIGGASFIGSHLADLLVASGCEEIIVADDLAQGKVSHLTGALESGKLRLVVTGFNDAVLGVGLLRGIDTVFHVVPSAAVQDEHSPAWQAERHASQAMELIERCIQAQVRKVVVASPVAALVRPEGPLATAMWGAADSEAMLSSPGDHWDARIQRFAQQRGLPFVALRYFDVYGPRMGRTDGGAGFLVQWMDRLGAGEVPERECIGQQSLDLIHVEDVARACMLAATSPVADVVLDIGTGEESSLCKVAETLARVMGRKGVRLETGPTSILDRMPPRAETHHAREEIGFEAAIPLVKGLESLVTWWCTEHEWAAPCQALQ